MLGRRIYQRSYALVAVLTPPQWLDFLADLVRAIGMKAVDVPKVWNYPVDGKGGFGQTIVQPITESFIALDTWPDHQGAYLFICSCKDFERIRVVEAAAARAIHIDIEKSVELALPELR